MCPIFILFLGNSILNQFHKKDLILSLSLHGYIFSKQYYIIACFSIWDPTIPFNNHSIIKALYNTS